MNFRSRDSSQPDLFGSVATEPAKLHRLFFALWPDEQVRMQLGQRVGKLREAHPALRARWVNPARYHATVHFLGDHPALRQDLVDAAIATADELRAPAFEWTLRHAASFQGRQPPCILRGVVVPEPMQGLWRELRQGLILAGRGRHLERNFIPHVTVGYSHGGLLPETLIEPVNWPVRELALIHSVAGQPDYDVLQHWPLGSPD